jgi:hypothetical protein
MRIGCRVRRASIVHALTDCKEFPHRSQLIVAQSGWQEVADYALAWGPAQVRTAAARDWQLGGAARF